ncbi:thiol-disulfide oxidoreductase DCC family protein [Dinghuibacter silviterrae]|uniref:DCC family thiol-disulfide oxidoreductase YuxK n=1 Tax=Dinghuibacter silviterrae TaxID=1539049 RepID=A0A4R8DU47_9BACT|nr:DUF393 domain-containing protein [Dinghuibacter silviterrae]TDX01874.1 hypothetical protein EDB95_2918 [Dinghuibacter silviterrae]
MTTLRDHIILYDEECPMCKVYTRAFTATGMLDKDGRVPYQEAICPMVDMRRAVNEIALVDKKTGEVKYGIDSLFAVLGNAWPFWKPLFAWKPFAWLMRKAYAFISYNRKVIIPAPQRSDFQPSFRLRYRIAYLLFSWLIVGAILTAFAPLVVAPGGPYREYLICGGQIFFQGAVMALYARHKLWDYLGNMMTISLAGALLLVPALLLPLPARPYFMIVVALMVLEHIRRTRLLGLGWVPTITWILYRLIILYAIS